MEYQLIEAVFEAKHSLHRVIHFAKVPRGTFAALFLIDQMNREPQQERAMPGVTVSMLSDRLHNSRPAVTRLINDLEEQGYVVKLTAKQDRRFVYLMLTQEGQAVLCQAKNAFFTAVHEIGADAWAGGFPRASAAFAADRTVAAAERGYATRT